MLVASRSVTDEDIDECSWVTNDFGSHHVHGRGGRRLAQGTLTLTAVPLLGEPGVHVRELDLTFIAPVYAGDTVTATLEVTAREDLDDDEADLHCKLTVVNGERTVVLVGTGVARLSRELADARTA